MTLQLTKPISLTDIQTEFGAPLGTPLSAFVRGGAWVPDSATNAGVPLAKPIALTDLLGAAAVDPGDAIKLIPHHFDSFDTGTCTGGFTLETNGDLTGITTGAFSSTTPAINADEWHEDTPATVGADYEVRASLTAGQTPDVNAGLDVWLGLGTARTWSNTESVPGGTESSTLTLEFRLAAVPGTIIKTVTNMQFTARVSQT